MQELDKSQAEHVGGARIRPPVTTLALGEEGGGVTTKALGEEGPIYTTLALGEEGGGGATTSSTGGAFGSF
ncbi:MAG: hypothetical protein WAQ08_10165 [Aquabacterium sp.]|jgi:hypothetical protein|uniref:hypothetical protein n=1 Tax=Aquabacterium sp. TaxID=1872578 RepID=UPI003BB105FC